MQLITSQNHSLVKTGIEDIIEPDWYNLEGNICNPGIKYTESERQNPNRKGKEIKKKYDGLNGKKFGGKNYCSKSVKNKKNDN